MTFAASHSGRLGDIVYCLPALKWLAESRKEKAVLFVFPSAKATKPIMTEREFNQILPLLSIQPYIEAAVWHPGPMPEVEIEFNGFRKIWQNRFCAHDSLVKLQCEVCGVPDQTNNPEPWLVVDEQTPIEQCPVIVNKTSRYGNAEFPWTSVRKKYRGKMGFIGTYDEYKNFIVDSAARDGECDHRLLPVFIETNNCLQVARLIAGCKLFIGNQSSPYAIAEGLKHRPLVQEVWTLNPNCLFFQPPGVVHGWKGDIILPDV